jgi:hypothetical protein
MALIQLDHTFIVASWPAERNVHEARKQLNFSRWPEYGSEGQRQLFRANWRASKQK